MPWPDHHKARTREKIVQAAAAAFRAGGFAGVRVEDIMARAGLTHGGFYAHFRSKEELLREAVKYASAQTVEMLSKPLAEAPDDGRFQTVVDAYLSPAHVAHPEWGCPLATLGPEIARTPGTTHGALAAGVRNRLDWTRRLLPEDQRETASDHELIASLACMVGGVILARAVGGKSSSAVLNACREFLGREAGRHAGAAHRSQGQRRRPMRTARVRARQAASRKQ